VIPILDLSAQYQELKNDIHAAVEGVFKSGHFINGPNVSALESEIAQYVGCRFAVALNSGTDALHLALRALDIGRGDEVITTPFTFIATTEAIGIVGATPVFVDIDPATYNIDCAAIEAAISPRTKAIMPVHLYGAPAALARIKEIAERHHLAIIEDCAQAIGAQSDGKRVGSFGEFGAFSFFPSKNLGAFGDGGMLTTNSEELGARARSLRAHGGRVKYYHEELGVNSRLDEVQAAILRVKLPHLETWIERRRAVAHRYSQALSQAVVTPVENPIDRHVYHQYTIRVDDRDGVVTALKSAQIQSMIYYPVPLHLQQVHKDLGYREGSFPASEIAAREVLSLPMFPELAGEDQQQVIAELLRVAEPVSA